MFRKFEKTQLSTFGETDPSSKQTELKFGSDTFRIMLIRIMCACIKNLVKWCIKFPDFGLQ